MKHRAFFFLLIILVWHTAGVTITGTVIDENTSAPLPEAHVTFRVATGVESPGVPTDSNGTFTVDLVAGEPYPRNFIVRKTGYLATSGDVPVVEDTVNLSTIALKLIVEQVVTFCGTVADSVTGEPIEGVRVGVQYSPGPGLFFDQPTDSAGRFCGDILLSNENQQHLWIARMDGYHPNRGEVTAKMDSVPQKLLMSPIGTIRKRVQGRAIDSATGVPLGNARVVLSTNYTDVAFDTSFTGADGRFDRLVLVGEEVFSVPKLSFTITAPEYQEKTGSQYLLPDGATSGDIDFGDILVLGTNNSKVINRKKITDDVTGAGLFPSSTGRHVVFSVTLSSPERVVVKMYGLTGREVAVLADRQLEKGVHRLICAISHLSPGWYSATVTAGAFRRVISVPVFNATMR